MDENTPPIPNKSPERVYIPCTGLAPIHTDDVSSHEMNERYRVSHPAQTDSTHPTITIHIALQTTEEDEKAQRQILEAIRSMTNRG